MISAQKALLALLGNLLLLTHSVWADPTYPVRGLVRDAETQEPLPGVTVLVENTGKGAVSDAEGYYQLDLKAGKYTLQFSFISYEKQYHPITVPTDSRLDISLAIGYILTEEVIVDGTADNERQRQTVDKIAIDAKTLDEIPYLLGEVDPVKAVQLLPGVQAAGDGNTGFYVRGGAADQNLVRLDKATVYNASHLFGFFSVFNGNTVDEVSLIKGGIPAQYGGRLSSVLDVTSKSGDFQQWRGRGSLGLIAANLSAGGPLIKDRLSVSVAGRRTYYDLISRPLTRHIDAIKPGLDYYFYDGNVKLDYRISDRNRLTLSGYSGWDEFHYRNANAFSNDIAWGNQAASLVWNYAHSPRLLAETALTYSRYRMNFGAAISDYQLHLASSVRNVGVEHTLTYYPSDQHELTAGGQWMRHRFVPNDTRINTQGTGVDFADTKVLHAQQGALFVNDRWELSSRWTLSGGVRLTYFAQLGPFNRYERQTPGTTPDSVAYAAGESVAQYVRVAPRASVVRQINDYNSVKLAYDRAHQFVHMVPMSATSLPTDVWVPSSSLIEPQTGNQYSVGYFRSTQSGVYEGSVTVYYKDMQNQIAYRNGVLIGYDNGRNYDDNFLFGQGWSYGSEFFIKKKKGHLTGWLSYTLANARRRFAEVDKGRSFPARYDRRHDLSVLANYRRHPRWSFSGVFALASGNTMTLPVSRYVINGNVVNEYAGRNNFRMPMYHRLDLSATYEGRRGKRFSSSWVFSIYNVYSRLNPYYLYLDVSGDIEAYQLDVSAKQISLFPIIPSVTYRVSLH